jgi:hypothetical protein
MELTLDNREQRWSEVRVKDAGIVSDNVRIRISFCNLFNQLKYWMTSIQQPTSRRRYEMHSVKRRVERSRNAAFVAAAGLVIGVATLAFGGDGTSSNAVRHVKGRTVFSEEFPKVKLSVRKAYRFIGTQRVNLYGLAEAEQYVFATQGRDNTLENFYWIQFEHFLPSNDRSYHYGSKNTTQIGDLRFVYNVGSWPDYRTEMAGNPASDGAAIERLLEKRNLSFPHRAAHVRMFHLPSADHRSELMIIYGEALPQNSAVPVRKEGIDLDTESPDSAQVLLEHARQGLVIDSR